MLTEQEKNILKFAEDFYSSLKTIPPHLNITDLKLEELCRKYFIPPIKLITIIQEIMKEEFEKGNLFSHIKLYDIEPFLEKKLYTFKIL